MSRVQLWSCGGGRQSAGIAALIAQGRLPRPDHVCMVRLEWEVAPVWPYVDAYIRPAMEALGIPFTAIDRAEYATVDFWSGCNDGTLLIPAYTNYPSVSKLPEFCSNEWKQRVCSRWAALQPGWKQRGVDVWLGISHDEKRRRRAPSMRWLQQVYPLLDIIPMHISGCLAAIEKMGWPEPSHSHCSHCPNQPDSQWAQLTPDEWDQACKLDEHIRTINPNVYLHKQMIPLRMVKLDPRPEEDFFGGCQSGMCF